jgi:hypothetical protein
LNKATIASYSKIKTIAQRPQRPFNYIDDNSLITQLFATLEVGHDPEFIIPYWGYCIPPWGDYELGLSICTWKEIYAPVSKEVFL